MQAGSEESKKTFISIFVLNFAFPFCFLLVDLFGIKNKLIWRKFNKFSLNFWVLLLFEIFFIVQTIIQKLICFFLLCFFSFFFLFQNQINSLHILEKLKTSLAMKVMMDQQRRVVSLFV